MSAKQPFETVRKTLVETASQKKWVKRLREYTDATSDSEVYRDALNFFALYVRDIKMGQPVFIYEPSGTRTPFQPKNLGSLSDDHPFIQELQFLPQTDKATHANHALIHFQIHLNNRQSGVLKDLSEKNNLPESTVLRLAIGAYAVLIETAEAGKDVFSEANNGSLACLTFLHKNREAAQTLREAAIITGTYRPLGEYLIKVV